MMAPNTVDLTDLRGPKPLDDLTGKTYVVTGGNRGIGRGISYALAQHGANVAIIYRTSSNAPDVAKKIQEEFNHLKIKVQAYQCDVCDFERLQAIYNQIRSDFDTPISGVVANAGVSVVKPATELTRDDFTKVFGTNVFGVHNTCCAAAKLWMSRKEEGSIVIICSMSAHIVNEAGRNKPLTQAFYNSSKSAALQLMRQLAAEWVGDGIRVNGVSPGYVETDQTDHLDKDVLQYQREHTPIGRFAKAREISPAVLSLLSPSASGYCVGSEARVDGGRLLY